MENTQIAVLVVDDEPIAREVMTTWLEQLGFAVAAAESGAEALALAGQKRFDVIVTDVNLDDSLDGFQLAAAVADLQPHIQALFVSAQAWGPSQADMPDTTFLHKPFTRAELEHSIRFVLPDRQRLTIPCRSA